MESCVGQKERWEGKKKTDRQKKMHANNLTPLLHNIFFT